MPLEASLRPRAPAHAFISRTSVAIRSSIYGQIRGFSSDQTSSSSTGAFCVQLLPCWQWDPAARKGWLEAEGWLEVSVMYT